MISDYQIARQYDGAKMGDLHGHTFQVFAPGWWQVWRWWTYWTATMRGVITLYTATGRTVQARSIAVPARRRLRAVNNSSRTRH